MKIEFYKTILCPRCHLASRHLKRLKASIPDLEIESIEITTDITRAWKNGIRTVPALKVDTDILCGLLLSEKQIRCFIEGHCTPKENK